MSTPYEVITAKMLSLECRYYGRPVLYCPTWSETRLSRRFGLLVRRLRQAGGWSQEAFAERCGLHRTYIGAIERGEKSVTLPTAHKLARGLGLSLAQLFSQLETEPGKPVPDLPRPRHNIQ